MYLMTNQFFNNQCILHLEGLRNSILSSFPALTLARIVTAQEGLRELVESGA